MKQNLKIRIFALLMMMSFLIISTNSMIMVQASESSSETTNESTNETNNETGTTTETTNEEDIFRVGMEAAYPPFNWTQLNNSNGAATIEGGKEYAGGYDVKIAQIIADGLGKKLVVVKTEWDGLVPALTSGKIDAIIAGMSPTKERKETIDFTDIYYKSDLIMVVKSDSKYEDATSIKDFKGAKITAQLNTFHYNVIEQIEDVKKQTAMDNFTAMRVAIEAGMIDGYVSERPEGISATAANKNLAMVEFTEGFETSEEDTAISVGVTKNSELTSKINDILKGVSEEERQALMDEAIKGQPTVSEEKSTFEKLKNITKEYGPMFLRGAGMTLLISMTGTILGSLIGLFVGVVRTIPAPGKLLNRVLRKIANGLLAAYIEFFRGTPMIVQAMVIYYGSAIAFDIHMNRLAAAIFIVSINTGAYMSEIIRGGIVSIDKGQYEAAQAVGMNHFQTMKNVILPQVIRNILPATGNEFVINIKDTSVLNVISVTELYFQTKTVAGNNFSYFEPFFIACILYFIMTFTVTRILRFIERKLDGPDNYIMMANQMQVEKIPNQF